MRGNWIHSYWVKRLPVKVKREERFGDKLLQDHVLKHWHHLIHSNARPSHTKNTVKLGSQEGDPRLTCGLSKGLPLDRNLCKLHKMEQCTDIVL